jgi:tetratricopeptide (TPR) repeat protein
MKRNRRDFLGALGMGGMALALPTKESDSIKHDGDALADLLAEARFSLHAGEPQRALDMCWAYVLQAGHSAGTLDQLENTDILEMMNNALGEVRGHGMNMPLLNFEVQLEPTSGKRHFDLARSFSAIGQVEKALAEFEIAWQNRDGMCDSCQRDCLNNIGWCHYRNGQYKEALPWFHGACDFAVDGRQLPYRLAMENLLLTYAALKERAKARRWAIQYVNYYGRVPDYERRALKRIDIDADQFYVPTVTPWLAATQGLKEEET